METGHRSFPGGRQEAVGFIAKRGAAGITGLWLKQLSRIQRGANELRPRLCEFFSAAEPSQGSSRARIHVPILNELLEEEGMGGSG